MARSSLKFVLDQNLSVHMLGILKAAQVGPVGRITSLTELGFMGDTPDVNWIAELGGKGYCVVTRDNEILDNVVEHGAWKASRLSLLILKKWGSQPRPEIARRLLYWWPRMVETAETGHEGDAWKVPCQVPDPSTQIRLVTGLGPGPNRKPQAVHATLRRLPTKP